MCYLPGSTYDVYKRFKLGMHAKQERVESLNYSNDMMFLTLVYLSFLQPNKSFYLSKQQLFRRHIIYHLYQLQPINTSQTGKAPHGSRVYGRKSRVYEQYTRQDHPMGNTEKYCSIMNIYYIYIHTLYPGYCNMHYKCH